MENKNKKPNILQEMETENDLDFKNELTGYISQDQDNSDFNPNEYIEFSTYPDENNESEVLNNLSLITKSQTDENANLPVQLKLTQVSKAPQFSHTPRVLQREINCTQVRQLKIPLTNIQISKEPHTQANQFKPKNNCTQVRQHKIPLTNLQVSKVPHTQANQTQVLQRKISCTQLPQVRQLTHQSTQFKVPHKPSFKVPHQPSILNIPNQSNLVQLSHQSSQSQVLLPYQSSHIQVPRQSIPVTVTHKSIPITVPHQPNLAKVPRFKGSHQSSQSQVQTPNQSSQIQVPRQSVPVTVPHQQNLAKKSPVNRPHQSSQSQVQTPKQSSQIQVPRQSSPAQVSPQSSRVQVTYESRPSSEFSQLLPHELSQQHEDPQSLDINSFDGMVIDETEEFVRTPQKEWSETHGRDLWLDAPVKLLLASYDELRPKVGQSGKLKTTTKMWIEIQKIMSENGYTFTAAQVEGKFRSLKRKYKETKLNNKKTGRARKTCAHESELDKLLAEDRGLNPDYVLEGDEAMGRSREDSTASGPDMSDMSFTQSSDMDDSDVPPAKRRKKPESTQEKLCNSIKDISNRQMTFTKEMLHLIKLKLENDIERNVIEKQRNEIFERLARAAEKK